MDTIPDLAMLHCNTDTHTHARVLGGNRTCNLERPVALGKVVGGGEKKKRENKKRDAAAASAA